MNQPMIAPAAVGGSIVAGVAAMLVAGYRVVDCLQFRTTQGACDQEIADNALPLVAGVAAIAGTIGGLWTYNPHLRQDQPQPQPHRPWEDQPRDAGGRFGPKNRQEDP